jgi:DNA-binding XRE family transcriptional regulator
MKTKERKRDPRIQKLLDENKPVPFSLVYDALSVAEKKRADERAEYYENLFALREARHKKKLTQQQLADKVGIPRATISKIESGKRNMTFDTFHKVLKALNLRMEIVEAK